MHRSSFQRKNLFSLRSFTLIELLTVIAIIAILASITLGAANGLMKQAARTRAHDEITGMSTALESYKVDNGTYPQIALLLGPPGAPYGVNPTDYQTASQQLYQALSSKQFYSDSAFSTTAPATGKPYMTFKTGQLANYKTGSGLTYLQDPFGFSYGYSSGDEKVPQANYPYSGTGFFDLWSTGGITQTSASNPNPTNTWISNWSQQ